jgi:ferredoxin-NADP reductase
MSLLQTLGRDLRAITRAWIGGRPAPYSVRAALGRHSHVITTGVGQRPARIGAITRETADAASIEIVTDEPIAFTPGQFLTLIVRIDGEVHRRAYSISTAPHDGRVTITVKRIAGGRVSTYLVERAREGEAIEILGPSGSFGFAPDASVARKIVLIGGGSGITPLFSIARAVLHTEPRSRITLLFGNRTEADVIFRERLEELARDDRFSVRHVLGEQMNCEHELTSIDLEGADVYICGPEAMMNAARAAVLARDVDKSRVHEEKFTSPTQRSVTLPIAPQSINLKIDGVIRTLIARPGQTVLEAGLEAGAPMPYSCTMGGCGACKVKVVDGDVASEEPNCLTTEEREKGYVLACVGRATSTATIEVEP